MVALKQRIFVGHLERASPILLFSHPKTLTAGIYS